MIKVFLRLLFIVMALAIYAPQVGASIPKDNQKIPMDSLIRYGTLSNGLTYYIRHNEQPKNRADFYIAQKVGSVLEEDNQRGLAHFLEHMAFNGTKNFPRKNMLEYLQNNGIRFGSDINAYTSFDETVYYVSNIPTENKNLMDSVLLVLYDWGNEISLLDDEIEKERKVINEEWRTSSNAQMRMYENVLPTMYKGSRYANRLPIGNMDVVMNFKSKVLRDYYEKWYRPDQQGIIIVGDFDAAKMEEKVKQVFQQSTMPKNPAERKYFSVPNTKKPIYVLYKDSESASSTVHLYFKHDCMPKSDLGTMKDYKNDILNILTQILLKDRFFEFAQNPDCPYYVGYGYDDKFFIAATKDAFTFVAASKEDKSLESFEALMTEAMRVKEHGFTQSELDRAKLLLKTDIKNQYFERNKIENETHAQQYVDHFTNGCSLASLDFDTKVGIEYIDSINLDDLRTFYVPKLSDNNVVISIFGTDNPEVVYPSENQRLSVFNRVLNSKTIPYLDKVSTLPIIKKQPESGEIRSKKTDDISGITTLKLSNGATVYLKPTDFKNDEILMSAISVGGKWAYNGENELELKVLDNVVGLSQIGNYNRIDLNKFLSGKKASIEFSVGDPTENVNGASSKKDLEIMLQLNYALFTDLNKDESAFNAYLSKLKSTLSMRQNSPRAIFSDSIWSTMYKANPLYRQLKLEEIDKIDYDKVLKIAKERLNNAGDYSFSFVGNFDVDSISPLICKYIASLPDNNRRDSISYTAKLEDGVIENVFEIPMENPKTSCFTIISGSIPYSLENEHYLDILGSVLEINYNNTIREEEGGTYGVETSASLDKYNNEWSVIYTFDTNIKDQERLNRRAYKELIGILSNGADENIFKKVKEASIKQYEISLRNNNYWLSILRNKGIGVDVYTGYADILKGTTLQKLNLFVKDLYNHKNKIKIVMNGLNKNSE